MTKEFFNNEAKAKISALMDKHDLYFTQNPGGGCFFNSDRSISIQVANWYDVDTLKELLAGLRKHGLEPENLPEPT